MHSHSKQITMKQRIFRVIIVLIIAITSCQPNIYFNEPQPDEVKNSSSFPAKYIGLYKNTSDSSTLIINKSAIISYYQMGFNVFPNQKDSFLNVFNQLEAKGSNPFSIYKSSNDTLFVNVLITDTFFSFDRGHILREFKGRLMLNFDQGERGWQVLDVYLNKQKTLNFSELLQVNVENVKNNTKVDDVKNEDGQTDHYKINPTKKELKKIIRAGNFTVSNSYQKMD